MVHTPRNAGVGYIDRHQEDNQDNGLTPTWPCTEKGKENELD